MSMKIVLKEGSKFFRIGKTRDHRGVNWQRKVSPYILLSIHSVTIPLFHAAHAP